MLRNALYAGARPVVRMSSQKWAVQPPLAQFTQCRQLSNTRQLNALPAGFLAVYVAKKTVIFLAASLYGFKRLYKRLSYANERYTPTSLQPKTQWLLRHSFDATLKFANAIDMRAKTVVEKRS